MANRIEYTKLIPSNGYAAPLSRYMDSKLIYYGDLKKLTFTTYNRTSIPENKNDRYTVITTGYEYRPDKVSVDAYGMPDLWWKILEINGIKDVFDFKVGLTVRLPVNIY